MRYFNFDSLINKYSCQFTLSSSTGGQYDALGDWVYTNTQKTLKGAIIAVSERKVYNSNGLLTEKDKELFMTEPLGDIDGAFVLYDGEKYRVESSPQANPQFTGVWHYTLKWVSAFNGGEGSA